LRYCILAIRRKAVWAEGDLLLNLQFDGENSGNGSIKAFLDKLVIYRW
jgi:hypothetical protein